jgi:hypothetical protein
MADNVTLPATGEVVTTDEAGDGSHLQLVKLAYSADGQRTPITADAAGLLVTLGSTSVNVVEPATVITGAAAQTAAVNNILSATSGAAGTNVANFRSMSVQVVSTGTGGTFIFEQSIDGVNWPALPVFNAALTTGVPITTAITATASSIIYTFPVRADQVRLRIVTPITGGSIRAHTRLSTEPWTPTVTTVAQPTAASLLTTVSGSLTSAGTTTATPATPTASIVNSAATTNGTVVKATAGTVYGIVASNTNAAARFLKLHNSATVTPGTTAVALTIEIPPSGVVAIDWGPLGMRFTTGICLSITGAAADNDTTAILAGEVKVTTSFI